MLRLVKIKSQPERATISVYIFCDYFRKVACHVKTTLVTAIRRLYNRELLHRLAKRRNACHPCLMEAMRELRSIRQPAIQTDRSRRTDAHAYNFTFVLKLQRRWPRRSLLLLANRVERTNSA